MSAVENQVTQLVKPMKLPEKPHVHGKILCLSIMACVSLLSSVSRDQVPQGFADPEGRTVLTPAKFQGELDMTCKPPLDIGHCKVLAPWYRAHCLSIPPVASGFLIHE